MDHQTDAHQSTKEDVYYAQQDHRPSDELQHEFDERHVLGWNLTGAASLCYYRHKQGLEGQHAQTAEAHEPKEDEKDAQHLEVSSGAILARGFLVLHAILIGIVGPLTLAVVASTDEGPQGPMCHRQLGFQIRPSTLDRDVPLVVDLLEGLKGG
jgi:hypothetical protein